MKIWPGMTRLELSYLTWSRADDFCKCCGKTIAMLKNRLWTTEKERMHNGLRDWESDPIRSTHRRCNATFKFPCIILSRTLD